MRLRKIGLLTTSVLGLLGTMAVTQTAVASPVLAANYFVRPVLVSGAETIDGFEMNGATSRTESQGVTGYSESTVDLENGTVKMYAHNYGHSGLQTVGIFGERITVTNGAGTQWNTNFAIEGLFYTESGIDASLTDPYIYYDVGIAVFRPGEADWTNFNGRAYTAGDGYDPLIYDTFASHNPLPVVENGTVDFYGEAAGSLTLASDYEVFDIFVYTNLIVGTQAGDGLDYFEADFGNTATFSQTFAPGVSAYSSSGLFLGLTTPPPVEPGSVPEPGSLALFGFGLAALGWKKRKPALARN